MGRKQTPTLLKSLHGNPGKRRMPKAEPLGRGQLWSPPSWFDKDQRKQWRYAVEHAPPGLLTATDREVLVVWVVACVEHAKAVVQVRALGQVVKTADGNAIQNPFLPIVNKQAMLMMKAGSEMGFSPAARASLGNAAPEFNHVTDRAARPTPKASGLEAFIDANPDRPH